MNLKKIQKFIQKQKVCLIGSVDEKSYPHIKAMLKPRKINGLKEFYFSTNTSSMRVNHYFNHPYASIYFFKKGWFCYTGVLFIGKMEVLTNQEIKKAIWKKGDTRYYQKGVTDPDYCVLKFTAIKGRYYCNLQTEDFKIEEVL